MNNEWETPQYLMCQKRLLDASVRMHLDENILETLRHPKRALTVTIPTRLDDGSVHNFVGYRVHHSIALGPGKGGLRFHHRVNLGEIAAMAMLMTWKCSLMNLPYGGAHGGICLDPAVMSRGELERVTRRYVSEIIQLIGPEQDIMGPDLNTNEQTMSWILDTYSVNVGYTVPSIVTGKPTSIGGSVRFLDAAAHGIAQCADIAAKYRKLPDQSKVIVQGMGAVGCAVANILKEKGFIVVGISDAHTGLYNPQGLNMEELSGHLAAFKGMANYSGADKMTSQELLTMKCDVLAPCAVPDQITKDNASRLQCKIIVEGANAPTTPEADEILSDKGILLVPDILANASGVTVGYFEWVQGLIRLVWTEDEIMGRLNKQIASVSDKVIRLAEKQKLSWRQSAMQLAIERVAEAKRVRGLYP